MVVVVVVHHQQQQQQQQHHIELHNNRIDLNEPLWSSQNGPNSLTFSMHKTLPLLAAANATQSVRRLHSAGIRRRRRRWPKSAWLWGHFNYCVRHSCVCISALEFAVSRRHANTKRAGKFIYLFISCSLLLQTACFALLILMVG